MGYRRLIAAILSDLESSASPDAIYSAARRAFRGSFLGVTHAQLRTFVAGSVSVQRAA